MIKPLVSDPDLLIYQGHCLDVLRGMDAESVDAVVTSPPYLDARPEYPSPSPEEFLEIFTELRRVVTGPMLLNVGRLWRERRELLWWTELLGSCDQAGWVLRDTLCWCLSGGTRVYARMQKGDAAIMLKDLVRCCKPEDVKLWNGSAWTQVLGWSHSLRSGQLEIELRSGEKIGCTEEHQWPTQRGLLTASELRVGDVIDSCRLPEPPDPLRPGHLPDDIGWFVGMYIAEGSRGKGGTCIQIGSHVKNLDRFRRLQKIASDYGGTCRMHQTGGQGATINLEGKVLLGILDQYVAGRVAQDKHLHRRCWRRSDDFLRGVLDGYLEGDGGWDEKNNRWRLGFSRNDCLADDLRLICARLGVSFRLKPGFVNYDGRRVPIYRGQIRFTASNHSSSKSDTEIVKISRSRSRNFFDVSVADEPHLFALASGVLTHNCKLNPNPLRGEVLTDAHEYVFLLGDPDSFNTDEVRTPYASESIARMSRKWKNGTVVKGQHKEQDGRDLNPLGARPRSVFSTNIGKEKGNPHPAPMALDLANHLVKLATAGGNTILDPFGGSGNTAIAARANGRKSILIELNPEYAELAASRLAQQSLLAWMNNAPHLFRCG